jgi:hypothetical protein
MKERETDPLSNQQLKKALIKRAMGFDAKEVIEEYVGEEDGVKLTKKKVTYKFIPPDVTALKLLIEGEDEDLSTLSDEELIREKERLLKSLRISEELNKEKEIDKKRGRKPSKKAEQERA